MTGLNQSPPSNIASATVASTDPAVGPPTALTASQLSAPGQVSLGWAAPAVGTATSYDVYRDGAQLGSATGTSYLDTAAADGTSAVYTVVANDSAGRSASADVSITPDWSPPTPPASVTVAATNASTASLSWQAASDAVGVSGYIVVRTDAAGTPSIVANVLGGSPLSLTDPGRTPGATYQYFVSARDAAGNVSNPATASLAMPLFTDGFESAALGPPVWTAPTLGLSSQQTTVHSGAWAAEEISSGAATWSAAQLPGTYRAVHASAWVYVKTRISSAGFLKLRTANGAYIAYLYVNAAGLLAVRNDAGNVTHVSSTPVTNGQWHRVEYYLDTNPGGPITISAAIDGGDVTFSTPVTATETLGSAPIGQLVLGDTVTGRSYDIVLDDVAVDTLAR